VESPETQFVVSLQSDYQLEDLIIEGVRATADVPVAQTTINKKEIEKRYVGQHPIFVLEELTPGIMSYSESGTSVGNYGQIRLRGIGQERVNFTLNGVPLNDMIDHGVFFSNFTDISSSFESIQVQRGVGTSSNGVASYAGSINFESFNLRKNPKFSAVTLGAGSFDTYRANFQTNTGVNEQGFGFYSSFSKFTSGGYKRFTESDAYSFFLTGGYFGERDMFRVTAFTGRSENGLGYYPIEESILEQDRRFNNLTEDDNDDFAQHLIQLQYNRQLNQQWSTSSTLYFGQAAGDFAEGTPDVDSIFVENYGAQYPVTFFQINYPLFNQHLGAITNLNFENDRWQVNTGLHLYTFGRENREEILPHKSNPYYQETSDKNEMAWFVRANYQVAEKVSLFGDLQFRSMVLKIHPDYDFIGVEDEGSIEKNWQFFNPKIGASFDLGENWNAFVSYARSGREPTKIDLFGGFQLNASNLNLVQAEAAFEPEYVNDLEAGINYNSQKLALETNVFYMNFENEIAPIGEIIAFGVQARENIAQSTRAGWESRWNYLLLPSLRFRGTLSYLYTNIPSIEVNNTIYTDRQHILSPSWMSNHGLVWEVVRGLQVSLDGNYMSSSFMELTNDPTFTVPDWYTVDLGINYQLGDQLQVDFLLNNLLDVTYYTYGTPADVDFSGTLEPGFLPQPPRNFFLTTTYRF
jgi:iron complex outermembrane receptor protein